MKEMIVRATFIEDVLGTSSGDPKLHETFIASKAPDAQSRDEEIEAIGVDGEVEKCKTIFPKDGNGNPFLYDYQCKGFFKDSQKALNRIGKWKDEKGKVTDLKLTAYKSKIDDLVFPQPRRIFFRLPAGAEIGDCQRPLRADTAQGPRVALANSESIPAGSWIQFRLLTVDDDTMKYMIHCLNYGILRGIGQWRNSGKGRFYWEQLDDDGKVIGGNWEQWKE